MSQENVEIVRSIYDAINRDDWDAAFDAQSPNVELTTPPRGPNAGTYRGRQECQGFFEDLLGPFEAWSAEPEEFLEGGDQVAVVVKVRFRPEGSTAELELRNGAVWTIREGTVVSVRLFAKPEEALEAAGLQE
jgi:uncharacterized protein